MTKSLHAVGLLGALTLSIFAQPRFAEKLPAEVRTDRSAPHRSAIALIDHAHPPLHTKSGII